MMLKEFNKAFGKDVTLEEEQKAFMNRATHFLTKFKILFVGDNYDQLFNTVCFQLGLNAHQVIEDNNFLARNIPNLDVLANGDFHQMLRVLVLVRGFYADQPRVYEMIDEAYQDLLDLSSLDLGITYKTGMFYPSGEKVLDADLINHSLGVLAPYPAEDADLRLALENYRTNKKTGIVETCYRCVEGLARQLLKNKQTLIDNKPELLRRLNMADPWKKTLAAYVEFGNDYGRHANPNRHNASDAEVEGYLYQTCILIRLIIKIK